MTGTNSSKRRSWVAGILLFAAYFVAAKIGLALDAVGGFATLVWPPSGISLAALLLFGLRLWPAIALAAFLVNYLSGAPLLASLGISVGNTAEAILGAYLLRLINFQNTLSRVRDAVGLCLLAAFFSTLVSASAGVFSLWASGTLLRENLTRAWVSWWVGDALGNLIVAPLLLAWCARAPRSVRPRREMEAIALGLCIWVVSLIAFWEMVTIIPNAVPLTYLVFPALIWAALRFGPRGATAATAFISLLAVWGTARGYGPIVAPTMNERLMLLQLFMSVVAGTGLILAADDEERRWGAEGVKSSLQEKEVLLKEIHHRVKNNLQIIYTLINLEMNRVHDDQAKECLKDCRDRVKTMALIHEKLYQATDLRRINFADYIRHLVKDIFDAHKPPFKTIHWEVNSEDVFLSLDEAIPCGLAIYELVSNSLKHAFPGDREGKIGISLYSEQKGYLTLQVKDDGVGLPQTLDFRNAGTLGLRLVITLAHQLEGEISLDNSEGAWFKLTFPSLQRGARGAA